MEYVLWYATVAVGLSIVRDDNDRWRVRRGACDTLLATGYDLGPTLEAAIDSLGLPVDFYVYE